MQAGLRAAMFMALVVAFVVASGCTDTETVPLANASPPPIAPPLVVAATGTSNGVAGGGGVNAGRGSIYAVDPFRAQIHRFNASDVGLDVTPQATIAGPLTQLASPLQLAMDINGNRLYVRDGTRVLVFDNPRNLAGEVAPARVFNSTVGGVNSIAIDDAKDILYLGHSTGVITSYDAASTLVGPVTPSRTITGAATNLNNATGLFIDAANRLVEADSGNNAINTFENASAATGNIAPARSIAGAQTTLAAPFAIATDNVGTIYVGDTATSQFLLYANGLTATGNLAPSFSFSPAQSFASNLRQFSLEDNTTLIGAHGGDVGNLGGIFTWVLNDLRAGNAAPIRVIQAPTVGLVFVTGVAHDPNR